MADLLWQNKGSATGRVPRPDGYAIGSGDWMMALGPDPSAALPVVGVEFVIDSVTYEEKFGWVSGDFYTVSQSVDFTSLNEITYQAIGGSKSAPLPLNLVWRLRVFIDGVLFYNRDFTDSREVTVKDSVIPVRMLSGTKDLSFGLTLIDITETSDFPLPVSFAYQLDDNDASTVVKDSNENYRDGVASVNTSAISANGKFGLAFLVDGSQSIFFDDLIGELISPLNDWYLSLWFKPNAVSDEIIASSVNDDGKGFFIEKKSDGTIETGFRIGSVLSQNLKAYFSLEDNTATTDVVDATGNFTATANKNTNLLHDASGKVGSCFNFSGSSTDNFSCQFETTPGDTLAHDKEWCFGFWFYNPGTSGIKGLIGNVPAAAYPGFYAYLNGASQLIFRVRQSVTQYRTVIASGISPGWHHALLGQDTTNSGGGTFVFIDTIKTTGTQTGSIMTSIATTNPVIFGDTAPHSGFTSRMDEVSFYDTTPTLSMATALFNGGDGLSYAEVMAARALWKTTNIYTAGVWNHLLCTLDSGSGVAGIKAFLNGVENGSYTNDDVSVDYTYRGDFSLLKDLSGFLTDGYSGVVDQLLIGDDVADVTDASDIYNNSPEYKRLDIFPASMDALTRGCIASYPCNDNAINADVTDTLNGLTGTATQNTDQLADAGLIGGSFRFESSSTDNVNTPLESVSGEFFQIGRRFSTVLAITPSAPGGFQQGFWGNSTSTSVKGLRYAVGAGKLRLNINQDGSNYISLETALTCFPTADDTYIVSVEYKGGDPTSDWVVTVNGANHTLGIISQAGTVSDIAMSSILFGSISGDPTRYGGNIELCHNYRRLLSTGDKMQLYNDLKGLLLQ